MNSNNRKHRLSTLAALTLAATAFASPAFAYDAPIGAGEGLDPSQQVQMQMAAMQGAVVQAADTSAVAMVATDPTYTYTPASTVGPLSREEVREALQNWRNANILVPANEIGDTSETLAARDAFNDMQGEAIAARWSQESDRMAKARQTEYAAQLARQEIEAVLAAATREQPVETAGLDRSPTSDLPTAVAEPVVAPAAVMRETLDSVPVVRQ